MGAGDDYIGRWYVARRSMGVPDEIRVGWHDPSTGETEWKAYAHAETDGVGVVATFLREAGFPTLGIPRSNETEEPGWREIWREGKAQPPRPDVPKSVAWRTTREFAHGEKTQPAVRVIDEAVAAMLPKAARRAKVTLPNYLFWAVNRAVGDILVEGDDPYAWLYPVSVRGPATIPHDLANASSGVMVTATKDTPARDLHTQIHARMKAKEHWSLWKQAQLSRYLGLAGTKVALRLLSSRNAYIGSFSYVGAWPLDEPGTPEGPEGRVLVGVGPSSPNYPVIALTNHWRGKLAMTLKLHPYLMTAPDLAERVMDRWHGILTQETGESLS